MWVLDFGRFVAGRYVLDPRSWILVFGRFLDVCLVSGFSFLALRVLLEALGALNGLGKLWLSVLKGVSWEVLCWGTF